MTRRLQAGLADLAAAATPVDLRARVYDGARRITRRNRILGVTAGVVLVAGSAWGTLALWPLGTVPQPGLSASPTAPEPSATTQVEVDLRNATFTVPTYPGPWAGACPAGERVFADGVADVGPVAKLTIADVMRGDLDGAPGDEFVLMMQCATEGGSDHNPLAVRVEAGAVMALGWVNVDADGELLVLDPAEPIEIQGGAIRVVVISRWDGLEHRDKQTRTYAYRDGRMVQIDGPTGFVPAPTDGAAVDLRNTTLYVSTSWWMDASATSYGGYVKLVDGEATAHFEKIVDNLHSGSVVTTVAVIDTALVQTGDRQTPVAVFEVRPADGPSRWVVAAYHDWAGYAAQEAWNILVTGPEETIASVAAGPGQLSIETATGTRTFQFNPDISGPRWVEV